MAKAIQLAWKGLYTTMPNPRVGCILVKNGEIVGEGFTQPAGQDHAEVQALKKAGDAAKGATAYVTLEPCSHFGRTPPCANALVKAGVVKVFCAMTDPNPNVSGRGIQIMEQAGIQVHVGLLESEARNLNPGFLKRMTQGKPWVRAKMAQSLDGRTAMASGESKWITGPDARSDVQKWRARSCAMVTGIGTVLADDPSLTLRASELGFEPTRQPHRYVIDSTGKTPAHSNIVTQPGNCTVFMSEDNWGSQAELEQAGAIGLLVRRNNENQVSLESVIEILGREHNEVMIEAGAILTGAFLHSNLIDELIIYTAPKLLGNKGRSLLNLPIEKMSEAVELELQDARMVGQDHRTLYRVKN